MKLRSFMTTDNIIKTAIPVAGVIATKRAVSKALNTGTRVLGTVTGNRFAETRRNQFINSYMNPIGFMTKTVGIYFNKTFETQRQNERIDYNRELAGMSLPYREGDSGITL